METIRSIVRPLVGLSLIGMIGYIAVTQMSDAVQQFILTAGGIIIGFYFGERSQR